MTTGRIRHAHAHSKLVEDFTVNGWSEDHWRAENAFIKPYSQGGPNTVENLRLTHDLCNIRRGVGDG